MTTPDEGATLDRVAGVSRTAPRARYEVADPLFGAAALARKSGPSSPLAGLTLSLTAEVAEACAAKGDSGAREVLIPLYDWCGDYGASLREEDPRLAALRALLVEGALLSHPEALGTRSLEGVVAQSPEAELLAQLASLRAALREGPRGSARECVPCQLRRRDEERQRAVEEQAEFARKLSAAKTRAEVARLQSEHQARAYEEHRRRYSYGYNPGRAKEQGDCAHIAFASRAMELLCGRFPEVGFELIGLLAAARYQSARFVLGGVMTRAVVPRWLGARVRSRYDEYGRAGRRYGAPRVKSRWTSIRDRARAANELPPAQRAGVSYAATAWSYDAPLATLGWTPAQEAGDEGPPPSLREHADEERVEVERVLPAFALKAAKAAAKVEAPSAKPAPAKPAPSAKPAPAKPAPAKPAKPAKPELPKPAPPKPVKPVKPAKPAAKVEVAKAQPPRRKTPASAKGHEETGDDIALARAILRPLGISDEIIEEMAREGRISAALKPRR